MPEVRACFLKLSMSEAFLCEPTPSLEGVFSAAFGVRGGAFLI